MIKKISEKQKEKNKLKAEETRKLHTLFLKLWDTRQESNYSISGSSQPYVKCVVTGQYLWKSVYRGNSCCYAHILPKSTYPQAAMNEDNIVIVHPDIHALYDSDPEKVPILNELRLKLMEKYNRSL